MKFIVKANKDCSYTYNGYVYFLPFDFYTTVQLEDNTPDWEVKANAKPNLMKQIAAKLFGSIKLWKRVYLDYSDIEIERA